MTLATMPGGSRPRPLMQQWLRGPFSHRKEVFTACSLRREGAQRPRLGRKEKAKGAPGALKEQRRALQANVQSRSSHMQVSGATVNWGTAGTGPPHSPNPAAFGPAQVAPW